MHVSLWEQAKPGHLHPCCDRMTCSTQTGSVSDSWAGALSHGVNNKRSGAASCALGSWLHMSGHITNNTVCIVAQSGNQEHVFLSIHQGSAALSGEGCGDGVYVIRTDVVAGDWEYNVDRNVSFYYHCSQGPGSSEGDSVVRLFDARGSAQVVDLFGCRHRRSIHGVSGTLHKLSGARNFDRSASE